MYEEVVAGAADLGMVINVAHAPHDDYVRRNCGPPEANALSRQAIMNTPNGGRGKDESSSSRSNGRYGKCRRAFYCCGECQVGSRPEQGLPIPSTLRIRDGRRWHTAVRP